MLAAITGHIPSRRFQLQNSCVFSASVAAQIVHSTYEFIEVHLKQVTFSVVHKHFLLCPRQSGLIRLWFPFTETFDKCFHYC